MFDKSTVGLYRKIDAPASLQARVDALTRTDAPTEISVAALRPLPHRRLAAAFGSLAACAAAVLVFSAGLTPYTARLTYGAFDPTAGAIPVTASSNARGVPMAAAFGGENLSLTLDLDVTGKTVVSVSAGCLFSTDAPDAANAENSGSASLILTHSAPFCWQLESLSPADTPYLTVSGGGSVKRYELAKGSDSGVWYLSYVAP